MEKYLNFTITILATVGTYLFGAWDMPLQAMCIFMLLDILTGMAKALYNGDFKSTVNRKGMVRKFLYFIMVIFAIMLDRMTGNDTYLCRNVVCFSFTANEGFSILENVAMMGLTPPKILAKTLEQILPKEEDKDK